jgi:hypothetical protein
LDCKYLQKIKIKSVEKPVSKKPMTESTKSSSICKAMRFLSLLILSPSVASFMAHPAFIHKPTCLSIYAPPGSGYATPDDETSELPDSYEPMMQFPGTMRPGKTPENLPFQDLPIGDNDPNDPVPWPHFQQIEWHHRWAPPHEHPIPMEDFIEMQGRWATPEEEALMQSRMRNNVRSRRELAEAGTRDTIITDDDDDEFDQDGPVSLGDGIFGQLGSTADQALTKIATGPGGKGLNAEDDMTESFDEGLDDFLLGLGLDLDLDDDDSGLAPPRAESPNAKDLSIVRDDIVNLDDEIDDIDIDDLLVKDTSSSSSVSIKADDDLLLELEDEDDDNESDSTDVPSDDFGDADTLDSEDFFDEGGFDFEGEFDDGGFDFDGFD